eukprot:743010-Amphidinium_carterae.2
MAVWGEPLLQFHGVLAAAKRSNKTADEMIACEDCLLIPHLTGWLPPSFRIGETSNPGPKVFTHRKKRAKLEPGFAAEQPTGVG